MRRALVSILLTAFLGTLAGCGGSTGEAPPGVKQETPPVQPQPKRQNVKPPRQTTAPP